MALGGHAHQTSTVEGYVASRAVDGNTNTVLTQGSCTHTDIEYKPWWRVKLSKYYYVRKVKITNRQSSSERLTNFDVRVGGSSSGPTNNNL